MKLGAFHYAKISGNFGPNENGTVRPRRKFSGQSGPPPEVVKSFRNFRFQFRSSSSLYTVVKMTDGSDVSVYECSVGKLQTQDLNFLLIPGGGGGWGWGLLSCISYIGIGRVSAPFDLKTGQHFAHFGQESGMVFGGTTGVYEGIYRFNS